MSRRASFLLFLPYNLYLWFEFSFAYLREQHFNVPLRKILNTLDAFGIASAVCYLYGIGYGCTPVEGTIAIDYFSTFAGELRKDGCSVAVASESRYFIVRLVTAYI